MQVESEKLAEGIRAHMADIKSRLTDYRERINNSKAACDRF